MRIGFDIVAAKKKGASYEDAPSVVPMREGTPPIQRRKPSTDQKKVRRLMTRKTASGNDLTIGKVHVAYPAIDDVESPFVVTCDACGTADEYGDEASAVTAAYDHAEGHGWANRADAARHTAYYIEPHHLDQARPFIDGGTFGDAWDALRDIVGWSMPEDEGGMVPVDSKAVDAAVPLLNTGRTTEEDVRSALRSILGSKTAGIMDYSSRRLAEFEPDIFEQAHEQGPARTMDDDVWALAEDTTLPGPHPMQSSRKTASTVADIADGDVVRAWVNGTLTLIGTPVSVEPYMDGYVILRAKGPFGPGATFRTDTPAYREDSGTWTITASKESTRMDPTGNAEVIELRRNESRLLNAMAAASAPERRALAEELEVVKAKRRAVLASQRDILLTDEFVRPVMTPVVAFQRTSTDTDWVLDVPDDPSDTAAITAVMRAEAAHWVSTVHPFVLADRHEFGEQMYGMAKRLAGQYGAHADAAAEVFMRTAAALNPHVAEEMPEPQNGDGLNRDTDFTQVADGVHPDMQGAPSQSADQYASNQGPNQGGHDEITDAPPGQTQSLSSRRVALDEDAIDQHVRDTINATRCPQCGSDNYSYNSTDGATCHNCGHHWWPPPPYAQPTASVEASLRTTGSGRIADRARQYLGSENPAYPNGQCPACGQGLDDEKRCQNEECSNYGHVMGSLRRQSDEHNPSDYDDAVHEQAGYGDSSLPTRNPAEDREVFDNFVPDPGGDGVHPDMPGAPEQSGDPEQANDGTTVTSRRRVRRGRVAMLRTGAYGIFNDDGELVAGPFPTEEAAQATLNTGVSSGDYGAEEWYIASTPDDDLDNAYEDTGYEAARRRAAYNPFSDPESSYNKPDKGPHKGTPDDLFPNGVPLHGDLTPEQQAWLKRRGVRVFASYYVFDDPDSARNCAKGDGKQATKHVTGNGVDVYVCDEHAKEYEGSTASRRVAADENGYGETSLDDVEVGDPDDKPMWEWELPPEGVNVPSGAADVADADNPNDHIGARVVDRAKFAEFQRRCAANLATQGRGGR